MDVWNRQVKPAMRMATGTFVLKSTSDSNLIQPQSVGAFEVELPCDLSEPTAKRQCTVDSLDISISKDVSISEKFIGMC